MSTPKRFIFNGLAIVLPCIAASRGALFVAAGGQVKNKNSMTAIRPQRPAKSYFFLS
jgi:hypothetical protein